MAAVLLEYVLGVSVLVKFAAKRLRISAGTGDGRGISYPPVFISATAFLNFKRFRNFLNEGSVKGSGSVRPGITFALYSNAERSDLIVLSSSERSA